MEPSPGADPGGPPIPRASGRRSEGHRSGSWTRTSVRLLQRQAGMPATHPGMSLEPPPGATPGWPASQGPPGRWTRGRVRSAGLEPASTWPSTMSVCQLRHERKRAATRGRTGSSAVRRRSRKPCAAASCPSWIRTTIRGFRGRRPAVRRKGTECGRCDSNAQTARFELARSSGCRHSRVRRLGFEPRTP